MERQRPGPPPMLPHLRRVAVCFLIEPDDDRELRAFAAAPRRPLSHVGAAVVDRILARPDILAPNPSPHRIRSETPGIRFIVWLQPDVKRRLVALVAERGHTMSWAFRHALRDYLTEERQTVAA